MFAFCKICLGNKPVSPYSGYNGQLRSCVYQPTELAIMTKGPGNVSAEIWLLFWICAQTPSLVNSQTKITQYHQFFKVHRRKRVQSCFVVWTFRFCVFNLISLHLRFWLQQQVESYDKIPRASTGTPMQDQYRPTSPSAHVDDMRQIYSNVCLRASSIQCLFALGLVCLPFFYACWSVVHYIVAIRVSGVFAMCPFLLCGNQVKWSQQVTPTPKTVRFFSQQGEKFLSSHDLSGTRVDPKY